MTAADTFAASWPGLFLGLAELSFPDRKFLRAKVPAFLHNIRLEYEPMSTETMGLEPMIWLRNLKLGFMSGTWNHQLIAHQIVTALHINDNALNISKKFLLTN